jgi:hypothetical protein
LFGSPVLASIALEIAMALPPYELTEFFRCFILYWLEQNYYGF